MAHDALSLLQDDHRRLQHSFERFREARSLQDEENLAVDIVQAMRVHLDLDRNVFYPALHVAGDGYAARQCLADHAQLEQLLDEIEHAGPTEDAFFAKIHVLCELFREHVQAEEKPRGVFEAVRQSPVDLERLAAELERRKTLLSIPLAPA
jgi:hypothetical protein